jgi:hypothetical protein
LCASFFLDFKVTSASQIKEVFGEDIIDLIDDHKFCITTFKDNLKDSCSDSVLLFDIALIYCANNLRATDNDKSIPFFILKDKYKSLADIQCNNNERSAYLLNVYNKLNEIGLSSFPFSSTFVSLYRAYEHYIIPSDKLIKRIIKARKEYSRAAGKYHDKYVCTLKEHEKKIKEAQGKLGFYISNNIISWLNIQDEELLDHEYQCWERDTLELLTAIMDEFKAGRPPRSLSGEYFATALLNMKSNNDIIYFINVVTSLFSIRDVYILNEFYKIIFHILGNHPLQVTHIDSNDIFNHIYNNSITEESIYSLADFIYGISKISDEEYLIMDTLLYSAINYPKEYQKIGGMILAYNPVNL